MELDKKLIITVREARKEMGKASAVLSDAEVKSIIEQLSLVAEIAGKAAHEQVFKK